MCRYRQVCDVSLFSFLECYTEHEVACTTHDGVIVKNVCSGYYSICGYGEWQQHQAVAPGTRCLNGNLVLVSVCEDEITDPIIVTEKPTEVPTEGPTEKPTKKPTEAPTEVPTKKPTEVPTEKPTEKPTKAPTETPTEEPTITPTRSVPSPIPCSWTGLHCIENSEIVTTHCTTSVLSCVNGEEVLTELTEG